MHGVSISRAANQSIPDSADTVITFDQINFDTDGYFSLGSPDRITIPASLAGKYLLIGSQAYAPGVLPGSIRTCTIGDLPFTLDLANAQIPPVAGSSTEFECSAVVELAAGAVLQLHAFQDSGAAINSGGDPPAATSLFAAFLGS